MPAAVPCNAMSQPHTQGQPNGHQAWKQNLGLPLYMLVHNVLNQGLDVLPSDEVN